MAEYTCDVCNITFDEEEKKSTNDENKCILHCAKNDWYTIKDDGTTFWSPNNLNMFWEKVTEYINKKTNMTKPIQNYDGMKRDDNEEVFVYEFNHVKFPYCVYKRNAFYQLNDGLVEKENEYISIRFNNCDFLGTVNFDYISKAKNVIFKDSTFHENVLFKDQSFEDNFLFEMCTMHKNTKFQNINFMKTSSFIGTKFIGKFELIHTIFHDIALFNGCKIDVINLENSFFRNESNFLEIKNKNNEELSTSNINSRETARIIKDSFEKQNNIIEANKYYAIEMKKREEELNQEDNNDRFEKIVFNIHGISSNHSQDALLALFWIINIGLVASIFNFYTMQDENLTYIHSNLDSLCISVYLIIATIFTAYCLTYSRKIFHVSLFIGFYLIYRFATTDSYLTDFSNVINPFSIMTKGDTLNLGMLIFKIIIAYLIYQFVVSVRQNTRRK